MDDDEAGPSSGVNGARKAKRRKFDYTTDGSIVKISLKNFMTFTEAKYTAHPKLNLIIGPNGSGKSSIVTALILGFGGGPKDINRGDRVSQFVKLGKSVADIVIELYKKSEQNLNLRRTIFASNEPCQYYINNNIVSKKNYVATVESLNIKVHNLCQFLPQDRLEDFSKLDSKGLLLNALQSIDNHELLDKFNELIKLAESMTTFDGEQKKLQNLIKSETFTNSKLETIVSSFAEKKSLEKELLVVLQKRSWSLYTLGWLQIKSESKRIVNAEKYNLDALSIIKKQRKTIENKKKGETSMKKIVLQNALTVSTLLEKINNYVETADCHVSNIKQLNKNVENTTSKISEFKESISSLEQKLENMKKDTLNVEESKQELGKISENIKIIDESIYPIKTNLEKTKSKLKGFSEKMYAIGQELEREKRKEDGKNQLLQRKYPEMWKAINWLQNCDKSTFFHGRVFEPLFTQIEVLDQKNARYIENIINYRDMIAFVFEYAEDLTKFNKIVKEERWQRINSISAPPVNFHINETSNFEINDLRQFGFYSYALDMIKVPSVIKRYLIRNYDMQNIPIGSKEVLNNIQRLPNNIGFFFAGNDQINIKTSMYTGEKITRQTQISSEAQFLVFSVDSNLIQTLTLKKDEVKKECEHFEQQQSQFISQLKIKEDSRQPLFNRKKEIQGNFIKFQNRQSAVDRMMKSVEFTKSELKREEEKSTKLINQNLQLIDKYFVSMNQTVELFDNYISGTKALIASAFILNHGCVDLTEDNKVLKQLKELYVSNLKNLSEYFKFIQKLDSEIKQMTDIALYWTRGVSPYDKQLFSSLSDSFKKIEQRDVEDLDLLIVEKKAKLSCISTDPNAPELIKAYRQRKKKIIELEQKLEDLNNNAQNQESQIEKVYLEWFPQLQELVSSLNLNFQKFLVSFGCSGVIELDMGVTRYDFRAYGLLIKVQFRNDDSSMRLLDAKSQSGGERALTTALFLLTLQDITHFPFRIVDEINQGMDKVYEKKLMELFMSLFDDNNNQYIVVTPKLINKLSFRNTSVDIIYCLKNE